jgi:hypothetical protein
VELKKFKTKVKLVNLIKDLVTLKPHKTILLENFSVLINNHYL